MIVFSVVRPGMTQEQVKQKEKEAKQKILESEPNALIYKSIGRWDSKPEDFVCVFRYSKKMFNTICDICAENNQEAFVFSNGYYERSGDSYVFQKQLKTRGGGKNVWDIHIPHLELYIKFDDVV